MPFRKINENKFNVFERKMLRKIYGLVKDDITKEWRRRWNIELKTLYSSVVILEVIRRERLRWTDHSWRSQNPLLRVLISRNPVGKIPLGRPRMRWENVVKKNVE